MSDRLSWTLYKVQLRDGGQAVQKVYKMEHLLDHPLVEPVRSGGGQNVRGERISQSLSPGSAKDFSRDHQVPAFHPLAVVGPATFQIVGLLWAEFAQLI